MPLQITVNVTQPLIERAIQRDSQRCMIAEAISAAHPDYLRVMVDLATIRWTDPKTAKRHVALTPDAAAAALVAFDRGEPVLPFSAVLRSVQITPVTRPIESKAAAESEGRRRARRRREPPGRTLGGTPTAPVIYGGHPLPTGHLPGTSHRDGSQPESAASDLAALAAAGQLPPEGASNVIRSGRRYRRYGLRLLRE